MNDIKVGIDKISLYLPNRYVDLVKLAELRGVDPNKWTIGIGQKRMAVIDSNEDIVSMGATAAYELLKEEDKSNIDQIIFATESSFDYSKSAASYLQELLKMDNFVKSYEIKQACYSTTAAIQIAADYIRLRPNKKVLVVSADISKYGENSSGEVTQGAGAIALLISSNPRLVELDKDSISYTENAYDFWKPEHSKYPIVESKFSVDLYIKSFKAIFEKYYSEYTDILFNLESIIFHLPFSKMGKKALLSMIDELESNGKLTKQLEEKFNLWLENYESSKKLSEQVGNLYTGSLYLSLISLLINGELKEEDKIGLFSYGSGCVAELLTGTLAKNYKENINVKKISSQLDDREEMELDDYTKNYFNEGSLSNNPKEGFFIKEIKDNKRYYIVK